ncbi:hypothetical protein [Baaleninema sp.]|uniref:hypothetical protein n=1 Tax=Baaleninema sp. TaxID=3101197 RepID=UPI003D047EEE
MRRSRTGLLTLCVLGLLGCTEPTTSASSTASTPDIAPTVTPTPTATPRSTPDPWQQGLDTAMGAATFARSAQSESDWQLVASQWQRAIELLKTVPETHPHGDKAQEKITQYQQNLAIAQQNAERAANPSTPIPRTVQQPSQSSSQTASTPSIPAKLALARHLKAIEARVYETYWCPVCRYQKEQFGASAYEEITRIECDPRGENPQPQLCARKGIQAYPTWEINGRLYRGGYSLDRLADLSGYEGSRNF